MIFLVERRENVKRSAFRIKVHIRIAGVTLAVSFGLLVIVPLRPFREIAFAMSVGILIDALIVRSLVVPAILALVGSASGWPGRRLAGRREAAVPVVTDTAVPVGSQDAQVS